MHRKPKSFRIEHAALPPRVKPPMAARPVQIDRLGATRGDKRRHAAFAVNMAMDAFSSATAGRKR